MEGMIGEIRMFAGNFAPKSWAFCSGQTVNIASNTALFSILGTNYGGNGTTTFALPDLRGRMAVGQGTGPGLQPVTLGQKDGTETVTLTTNNLPAHTHVGAGNFSGSWKMPASTEGGSSTPTGNAIAVTSSNMFDPGTDANLATAPISGTVTATILPNGAGFPFSVVGPYLAVYYVICQYGVYPSRN
ncbi:MAG: phage tail protein [Bacteroidia bacterium]|nr:phage tail protein [Bacteroidia bacterium]MBP7261741.1 phage tail protein [Bacteroidia bacterium]MBP9180131.1 phage tail protein [Bacteroidia bacterium]MBP9725294.1 phage tail protein [Bacteroidia bacterium]